MNDLKGKYNDILIPKELDTMINTTIQSHKSHTKKKFSLIASLAAVCIFTFSLNVSPSFAETMHQIPVIKNIANILTVRSYEFDKENIHGDVNIPSVDIEDKALETYINETINNKVNEVLVEAELRADEYKTAYLETGGTEEGFAEKNMNVSVDHEIYLQNDAYLSFRVFTHETLAAVYGENLYFNIDLKQQKTLALIDLLGPDYIEKITAVVKEAVKQDPDQYFDEVKADDWQARADLSFYLNDQENVTVVFEKYELASGAMGRLEFTIN